ncbi:hypothetical protein F1C58_16585 (plasmid) [Glaciihabitans sp. INWT7]|uniref:hypothetical protein n=1 Tax=Glaciihabitans sp. INWT7 TaxID=2596912 RepID=UPI0016265858|nr:hypothetical protein [Glaciihabitans sp. INWT7]QNE48674.1 hypothetical protein F1C58_16585 [Glaciihabitans sp. INWT7]
MKSIKSGTLAGRFAHARLSAKSVLSNKDGLEVSIPNIIVAIVVSLVVIGAVVAGIVFVVPFAQDSTARSDLQTVQSAEQVYYAQAAPPTYGSGAELVAKGSILKSDKKIKIVAQGDLYCAGVLSAAGHYYWVFSKTTTVQDTLPTANPDTGAGMTCPTEPQIAASSDLK